ncbi:membrane dipeptidase [Paraburkholderia caballeronis]|nr:membrane dipeptidase [Paraburkholderia caballeronis]
MSPRALLAQSLVWDNHGCMPLRPDDETFLPQLARYKAAGVNAVTLNVGFGEQGVEPHVRMIAHFRRWLAQHRDDYMLATTPDDIERARRAGKLAVLFDIEGMNAVADQPSLVQLYYDLGVRWMLIAYNQHNPAGGGCQEADDPGLTAYGRQILDEMARVGMVACCSHTGQRTAMDVMAYSSKPVLFSHSNARAIHDHPRNVHDDALKACAATGGVVGLNGIGIFIGGKGRLVDGLIRHIDHVVQLIGIEHVGLGLDYVFDQGELDDLLTNKTIFPPELGYEAGIQMVPPEAMEEIVSGLSKLGYSADDLRAILGGNLLRVARQVWRQPFGAAAAA